MLTSGDIVKVSYFIRRLVYQFMCNTGGPKHTANVLTIRTGKHLPHHSPPVTNLIKSQHDNVEVVEQSPLLYVLAQYRGYRVIEAVEH